ncbi:MAG: alpha/beta fold hydrolase [Acidobacteriota bacterium]
MKVEVRGVGWEVEDHGEGVPLLLIHGFPLSSEIWRPIRPALEQVARVITPDLRGFGESDAEGGDYDVRSYTTDVIALLDLLGIERAVIGGHSMGGYIAQRCAAEHRERLLGLLLVSTRASGDGQEARARRNAAIDHIRRQGSAEFLASFVPKLIGPSTRERAPRFADELASLAAEVPDHVLIGCLAGMRDRPDFTADLPGIDVPALVLVGDEDSVTPLEDARLMAQLLPRATLAVIPGAGHTPSIERPIATSEAIARFVREV